MLSPQDIPGAAFLQMLLDSCTRVLGVWLSVWGLLVSLAFDHLFLLLWVHTYYIRAQLDVLVGFRTISYETYRSWLGTFQDFFFFFLFGFFFVFFCFLFFPFQIITCHVFALCAGWSSVSHVCSVAGTKREPGVVSEQLYFYVPFHVVVPYFSSALVCCIHTPLGRRWLASCSKKLNMLLI